MSDYETLFVPDDGTDDSTDRSTTRAGRVSREQETGPTIESDRDLAEFIADVKDVPVDAAMQVLAMLDESDGGDVAGELAAELRDNYLSEEALQRIENIRRIQAEIATEAADPPGATGSHTPGASGSPIGPTSAAEAREFQAHLEQLEQEMREWADEGSA